MIETTNKEINEINARLDHIEQSLERSTVTLKEASEQINAIADAWDVFSAD